MKIAVLRRHFDVPWLSTAVITAGAVFAAVNASLWQASAFLPAFIVAVALDRKRRDR